MDGKRSATTGTGSTFKEVKAIAKALDEDDRRIKQEARRSKQDAGRTTSSGDSTTGRVGTLQQRGLKRTEEERKAKTKAKNANSITIAPGAERMKPDRSRNRNDSLAEEEKCEATVDLERGDKDMVDEKEPIVEEKEEAPTHLVEATLVTEPSQRLQVDNIATAEIVEEKKSWIPDSNTSKLFCFAVVLVLAGAIAVAGICGSGACSSGSVSAANTNSPSNTTASSTTSISIREENSTTREIRIREQLKFLIGFKLSEVGKDLGEYQPYHQALQWILYDDPLQLNSWAENLVQRYVLALFYLQTSQMGPWISCNMPTEDGDDTCIYYEFRREADNSVSYVARNETEIRWLSGWECDWSGLNCSDDGAITEIEILGQNLTGTLPTELQYLTALKSLSLSYNSFTGPIPREYGAMDSLLLFEVTENLITGQISDSLSFLTNLEQFNPSYNLLSGTIPPSIGRLTKMHSLFFFGTPISGTIPSELGQMSSLENLWLFDSDRLSGSIPSEIGNLSLLQSFKVGNVGLTGTLPSEFGKLVNLQEMLLARLNLNGSTIPEEFWNMESLTFLDLDACGIGGTLSTNIGKATNLAGFKFSRNSVVGTIPSELGLLDNLLLLWIHECPYLEGEMPQEVCKLMGPESLQFLNADCAGAVPRISCSCCTGCCDGFGTCQAV